LNNNEKAVTIIGAGPAGIATALQLKRMGIGFIIFEKNEVGGLLKNANLVENYPGFPSGITGAALADRFKRQLRKANIRVRNEEVKKLDFAEGRFLVETPSKLLRSRLVVIASGTKPKEIADLEIPAAVRKKIFYEIYLLKKIAGRKIVIVGAGDAAFDYGLSLSGKNDVFIVNRGEKTKCLPVLLKKVAASPRITYLKNIAIASIAGDSRENVRIECRSRKGFTTLRADFVVFAIGRTVELDFLTKNITGQSGRLQRRRLLSLVGDVHGRFARQTAIAVGDGVGAAMAIGRKLCEDKR